MRLVKFSFAFVLMMLLLPSLAAFASDEDDAYRSASECYKQLRSDTEAMKYRESWEKCIARFKDVFKKHRRGEKGADAKYSLGRLYEELAYYSKNKADWSKAVDEYDSFTGQFSRNKMTDDAYFRMAAIKWERLNDKEGAKKDLRAIIKHYKNSDMASRAEKYLNDIEANIVPEETGPKGTVSNLKGVGMSNVKDGGIQSSYVIVIDPGHGGSDTGAVGPKGTQEKDITLSIAKKLFNDIKKNIKGSSVYLTRDDDKTIDLDDRVKFANKKKADLFISIHANASTDKKEHGVQTYYLNNASDKAAQRLAAQENKHSGKPVSDLDKILSTMIQNASTEESRMLAGSIHKNLLNRLSKNYSFVNDQKVRSAMFYVLVGVKSPSVLVEVSYLSNPAEEKRLGSEKYQRDISGAITSGLVDHIRSVQKGMISRI